MKNKAELKDEEGQGPLGSVNSYAKWSGLGFQMLAAIGLGVWGGLWLDKKFNMQFPAFTVGLSLLGVVTSLVIVYRQVVKN